MDQCDINNMVAQVCVGKAPTFDGRKEFSTIPFHRESPVSPNWTGNFDAVGDVKQCVYCERTRRQSLRVILIVIPVFGCFESAQIRNFEETGKYYRS